MKKFVINNILKILEILENIRKYQKLLENIRKYLIIKIFNNKNKVKIHIKTHKNIFNY